MGFVRVCKWNKDAFWAGPAKRERAPNTFMSNSAAGYRTHLLSIATRCTTRVGICRSLMDGPCTATAATHLCQAALRQTSTVTCIATSPGRLCLTSCPGWMSEARPTQRTSQFCGTRCQSRLVARYSECSRSIRVRNPLTCHGIGGGARWTDGFQRRTALSSIRQRMTRTSSTGKTRHPSTTELRTRRRANGRCIRLAQISPLVRSRFNWSPGLCRSPSRSAASQNRRTSPHRRRRRRPPAATTPPTSLWLRSRLSRRWVGLRAGGGVARERELEACRRSRRRWEYRAGEAAETAGTRGCCSRAAAGRVVRPQVPTSDITPRRRTPLCGRAGTRRRARR